MVFSQDYEVLDQCSITVPPARDDDGDDCEDIDTLEAWIRSKLAEMRQKWFIEAVNFSAYGATLVHLDRHGKRLLPVYDYLKKTPGWIADKFYDQFGGREAFSMQTGSPALEMLNSGYQLFWLKKPRPEIVARIAYSLHLPQYLSWLFTRQPFSDMSSIGCHTGMWDVGKQGYHTWLKHAGLQNLLPPPSSPFSSIDHGDIRFGIGLHDSSAALIPYSGLQTGRVGVLSTGTWNIFLVPGYTRQLTREQYAADCLYYYLDQGHKVAASRLHLGAMVETATQQLKTAFISTSTSDDLSPTDINVFFCEGMLRHDFMEKARALFTSFGPAYAQLVHEAADMQLSAIKLLCDPGDLDVIHINGGFAGNHHFVNALQTMLPDVKISVTEFIHASALGAAMVMQQTATGLQQNK